MLTPSEWADKVVMKVAPTANGERYVGVFSSPQIGIGGKLEATGLFHEMIDRSGFMIETNDQEQTAKRLKQFITDLINEYLVHRHE